LSDDERIRIYSYRLTMKGNGEYQTGFFDFAGVIALKKI